MKVFLRHRRPIFFRMASPLLLLCALLLPASGLGAGLIALDTHSTSSDSQVILQLDAEVRYSEHRIPYDGVRPDRYYVDLYDARPSADLPKIIHVESAHVGEIRIGVHDNLTRVAVDLPPQHDCAAQNDGDAHRIIMVCRPLEPQQPQLPSAVAVSAPRELSASPVRSATSLPLSDPSANMPATAFPALSVVPEKSFSVSGRVFGFGAADLKKDTAEDHQLLRMRNRLTLEHEGNRRDVDLLVRGTVEWDALDYDNQAAGTDSDLNLFEGYLKFIGDCWDFSVGTQRVRWGKSDQLSPLDSINPDDLRQFMTLDLEERKTPSWLARLRLHGESLGVEAILSPWFETSELDYFDSDWALYRNLRQTILDNPQLPQSIKDYAAGLRVRERVPSDSLENMSAALRLTWQTDSTDYAVSYRYGWENLPTITRFPVKNITFSGDPDSNPAEFLSTAILTSEEVEARFKRQQIVGFEWETVLDPVGFRGEVAYFDQVALLASDLTSRSKEAGHLVAGIDYSTVDDWYFNLQTSWYRIFAYDESILYFERDNVSLLGEIRKTLWRGNLELSTRYNYTLTDGSSYLQPAITLKYFPNTEWESGVMLFDGGGETLLGSYDRADQAYTQVKVSF